jgi:hypothetical protein
MSSIQDLGIFILISISSVLSILSYLAELNPLLQFLSLIVALVAGVLGIILVWYRIKDRRLSILKHTREIEEIRIEEEERIYNRIVEGIQEKLNDEYK